MATLVMHPQVHLFRVVYSPATPITPKTIWRSQPADYDTTVLILGAIVDAKLHQGKLGLLVDPLLPYLCYMEVFDPLTKTWEEFMDENDEFVDARKKFKKFQELSQVKVKSVG